MGVALESFIGADSNIYHGFPRNQLRTSEGVRRKAGWPWPFTRARILRVFAAEPRSRGPTTTVRCDRRRRGDLRRGKDRRADRRYRLVAHGRRSTARSGDPRGREEGRCRGRSMGRRRRDRPVRLLRDGAARRVRRHARARRGRSGGHRLRRHERSACGRGGGAHRGVPRQRGAALLRCGRGGIHRLLDVADELRAAESWWRWPAWRARSPPWWGASSPRR